jgi:hypothetical protein
MSNDNKQGNETERKTAQQSQDAARHEQDAAHHKLERGSQRESGDRNDSEPGEQPEIPKIGSRDAPGG